MELKRRLDLRYVFVVFCLVGFFVYLLLGLQVADAVDYRVDSRLNIPSIGLDVDVTNIDLDNGKLNTPDRIVGSYSNHPNKTLLIGHSTTAFQELKNIRIHDAVEYDGSSYDVISIEEFEKNQIDMNEILQSADESTLVLMTCAGELLEGGGATHRLIVTAVLH